MEGDKLLVAAGVTVAAVVSAFVLWGPSVGSSRLRQRRGEIAGLHNFGRTCFLNTLLQALAACPQFMAWLQLYSGSVQTSTRKKKLVPALLSTLEVINGTHTTLRGDPYSPGAVLGALHALGWITPETEQDAHELFCILLTSLEEELNIGQQRPATGSLSDALLPPAQQKPDNDRIHLNFQQLRLGEHNNRPSSAMLTNFLNSDYDESTNVTRLVRSEAHTPDSPASGSCERNGLAYGNMETEKNGALAVGGGLAMALDTTTRSRLAESELQHSDSAIDKRISSSCRSLERLVRGPGRISVWSDMLPSQVSNPFRGAMGIQFVCNTCEHKYAVHYDKFDSVTLNLPSGAFASSGLSLGHLLSELIAAETVKDVRCESCDTLTCHTKSTTFAKLPACLCIHISRTVWQPSGRIYKRQDYVHFPESLSMAPYSFVQPHLNSQAATPWGSTVSLFSSSLPTSSLRGAGFERSGSNFNGMLFPRNLYRLLAVVVHSGEANSGHFITYRRGALRNSHRWFYTSDTIVREVDISEVLRSPAYMLFYDRGTQRNQMSARMH